MPTRNVQPQRRRSSMHGSYFLTGIILIAASGIYMYSYYVIHERETAATPRHIISMLLGDLQKFHKEYGRYPETLAELQDKLWRKRQREAVPLGEGGRSMARQFYFYLYGHNGAHSCKFWAVPLGARVEGMSSYYIELSDGGMNVWKGAPLEKEELAKIQPLMSERALFDLGLTKQAPKNGNKATTEAKVSKLPFL